MPSPRRAGTGGARRRDGAVHRTGGGVSAPPGAAPTSESGPRWPSLSGLSIEWMRCDRAVGDVDREHVDEAAVGRDRAHARLAVDERRLERDAPLRGQPREGAEARGRSPRRPTSGRGSARALPPPSPTSTASGASTATSPSMSPSRAAARKRAASAWRCSGSASKRGRSSPTRRRARLRIWRQLSSDLPSTSRDLGERVVEGVAQHEHGALVRRQALEQHEEGERDRPPRPRPGGGPRPRPAARAATRPCRSRAARAPSAARRSPGAS